MTTPSSNSKSTISAPDTFDGKNYTKWYRQLLLYHTFYKNDFSSDDKRIISALSYMKSGNAQLWAENAVNQAIAQNPDGDPIWGKWPDFKKAMDKAFVDPNEERMAQHSLSTLRQGRSTAKEFFNSFDRLLDLAGYGGAGHDKYLIELMERALNPSIIRKMYAGETVPTTYQDFKTKALAFDALDQRLATVLAQHPTPVYRGGISNPRFARALNSPGPPRPFQPSPFNRPTPPPPTTRPNNNDVVPMDVDRRATSRRNIICWSCGEAGHIANNCPKTLTTQLRMMTKEQRDTLLAEVDFTDEEKDESEAEVVRQTEVVIPNKKGF
jgi:hypothetical protein